MQAPDVCLNGSPTAQGCRVKHKPMSVSSRVVRPRTGARTKLSLKQSRSRANCRAATCPSLRELKRAEATGQSDHAEDEAQNSRFRRVREWAPRAKPRLLQAVAFRVSKHAPLDRRSKLDGTKVSMAKLESRLAKWKGNFTKLKSKLSKGRLASQEMQSERSRIRGSGGKKKSRRVASIRPGVSA